MKNFKKVFYAFGLLLLILTLLVGCAGKEVENISLDDIPEYSGEPYIAINGNIPFFEQSEITATAFESFSELDPLGRCGVAYASVGQELMPSEERGNITSVTPSGWEKDGKSNNNKYDFVDGSYIYNRCHLIGFQLTGENANEKNLITGTRYLNIEGMLPFENMIADYVKETDNHVMYRVTPIYDDLNLVASGVLLEAWSVEDDGEGICFCVYSYNVQPGVLINYFNGVNVASGEDLPTDDEEKEETGDDTAGPDYIVNTSSKKFHIPGRSCANQISEKNRQEYFGTRENLINEGYEACGTCKP